MHVICVNLNKPPKPELMGRTVVLTVTLRHLLDNRNTIIRIRNENATAKIEKARN